MLWLTRAMVCLGLRTRNVDGPEGRRAVTRDELLEVLRTHKPTLIERFGVTDLALFGSFARDEATDASDVDILVRFDSPPDWRRYFGVQFYLEDLLGRPVGMAAEGEVRAEVLPFLERDAINV